MQLFKGFFCSEVLAKLYIIKYQHTYMLIPVFPSVNYALDFPAALP